MGYESKLYVIEKCNILLPDDKHKYADVIAAFDLCKCGLHRRQFRDTEYAFYADDGNTLVTEDCYGDTLGELTVDEVIKLIEQQQATCPEYRRWNPCLTMLRSFSREQYKWHNLAVLHFGH